MRNRTTDAGRQLDRLYRLGTVGGMTDAQLLEQFVTMDDETAALAFEAIVERYGSMVLRVCRGWLRDEHAAEDAFQATFLVLARKAGAIGSRELLSNWLYGVAVRTARKAKVIAARRRIRDQHAACQRSLAIFESPHDVSRSDLERVLHEEIDRLPGAYRTAVVACYFEGKTQAQAAQQLGLAESTIRGRLARARKRLGRRLTRRGLALSTGLVALATSGNAAAGPLPGTTVHATARAALLFVQRGKAMKGVVSVTPQAIANGVLSTMWFSSLKTVAAIMTAAGFVIVGTGLLVQPAAEARLQADPSREQNAPEIAVASPEPNVIASPEPARDDPKTGQEQAKSFEVDTDLMKKVLYNPEHRAPGSIIRAFPVSQDCMTMTYMPDWNFGNIDNFGLQNSGARVSIDWPAIPREDATSPDRQFLIAMYSRKTTSYPPAGPIHAFEILEGWREMTSWRTRPKYDPEPAATYKFEPGDGWKLFDITPLVRAQAKAARPSHGILLRFLSEDAAAPSKYSGYDFVSREGTGEWANRRPVLLVVKASKPENPRGK
jgi:RNA polymerase sigma factor (sigma-70 family)